MKFFNRDVVPKEKETKTVDLDDESKRWGYVQGLHIFIYYYYFYFIYCLIIVLFRGLGKLMNASFGFLEVSFPHVLLRDDNTILSGSSVRMLIARWRCCPRLCSCSGRRWVLAGLP